MESQISNISSFVAIDFETANSNRASVCSMGIAVVKDLKIIDKKYWLIRPFELYFEPFNVFIHGITENDVKDKPEFKELYPEIKNYLENNLIIAHNASFDISVLRHVLYHYGIEYPEFNYCCTWYIGKRVWSGILSSFCLENLADYLGIKFQHHNALEDAVACALIAIEACNKNNVNTLQDLSKIINLGFGYLKAGIYNPVQSSIKIKDIIAETDQFDENSPIFKKSFVFTGTLESMVRKDAMQKVVNTGGICHKTVREDTDFLVIGIQDYKRLRDGRRSNKMIEAEDLVGRGFGIEIINEDDFLRMFD